MTTELIKTVLAFKPLTDEEPDAEDKDNFDGEEENLDDDMDGVGEPGSAASDDDEASEQ